MLAQPSYHQEAPAILSPRLCSLLSQRLHARSVGNNISRSSSSLLSVYPRLGAPIARALTLGTRAYTGVASALTSRLLSSRNMFHCLLVLLHAATAFPTLQIRQASCFGMDVSNLLIALRIEAYKFLTSRRAECFFEVGVDASPSRRCLISDTVALVQALGAICRFVFRVKL